MKSLSQTINFSPRNLAASVTLGVLICLVASNTVFADSVTYNQNKSGIHNQKRHQPKTRILRSLLKSPRSLKLWKARLIRNLSGCRMGA